jgi:hypothetical protein
MSVGWPGQRPVDKPLDIDYLRETAAQMEPFFQPAA